MMAARARLLVATMWVGSLWTIGYVAAPTLFATLSDRALAGTIAGMLFRVEAWLSVLFGVLLIALLKLAADGLDQRAVRHSIWIAAGMLACTLIGYFGLQPFMAALRDAAGPGGVMDSAVKARFGMLHGLSSAVYLIQSLLGIMLILKVR